MRLVKLIAIILLAIYIVGCAGSVKKPVIPVAEVEKQEPQLYNVDFGIILKEVERPADTIERYGERRITQILEDGIQKNRFDDDMIGFTCHVDISKVTFVLENKTEHSIHILWDEAAFVDENRISHKVMHSGVKYVDRYKSQPPSTVVRMGIIIDSLVSSDSITDSSEQLSEQMAENALRHKYDMTRIQSRKIAALNQKLSDSETELVLIKNTHVDRARPLFPVVGILDTAAIAKIKERAGDSQRPLSEVAYKHLARWTYDQVKTSAERHIGKTIQVLLPLRIEPVR